MTYYEYRHTDQGLTLFLFSYIEFIINIIILLIYMLNPYPQQSPLNILLSINYRTKPEILRFISSVFYGGPENLKAYGRIPSVVYITPLMFYAVQVICFDIL